MNIPIEIVDRISTDAVVLRRNDLGWRSVHESIRHGLFVKRTDHIFSPEMGYHSIKRVDSFFCEDRPMYTWTRRHERLGNLYIYGNPFPRYEF